MNYLSSNLDFLIKSRGISSSQLARACSVKESAIQSLLQKKNDVSISLLIALTKELNVSLDVLVKSDLKAKAQRVKEIKLLVLDIDGVLTDGGMYYTEKGDEFKKFNTKDGLAIKGLVKRNVQVGFLSNGINAALIKSRAKLLGVQHVYVGLDEKEEVLDKWVRKLKISYQEVAYVGDDINDSRVIAKVGFSACPSDASEIIKQKVTVILSKKGGEGCVRELIDNYFL